MEPDKKKRKKDIVKYFTSVTSQVNGEYKILGSFIATSRPLAPDGTSTSPSSGSNNCAFWFILTKYRGRVRRDVRARTSAFFFLGFCSAYISALQSFVLSTRCSPSLSAVRSTEDVEAPSLSRWQKSQVFASKTVGSSTGKQFQQVSTQSWMWGEDFYFLYIKVQLSVLLSQRCTAAREPRAALAVSIHCLPSKTKTTPLTCNPYELLWFLFSSRAICFHEGCCFRGLDSIIWNHRYSHWSVAADGGRAPACCRRVATTVVAYCRWWRSSTRGWARWVSPRKKEEKEPRLLQRRRARGRGRGRGGWWWWCIRQASRVRRHIQHHLSEHNWWQRHVSMSAGGCGVASRILFVVIIFILDELF